MLYVQQDFEHGFAGFECLGHCNLSMATSNSGGQSIVLYGGQNNGMLKTPPLELVGYDTVKVSFLIYGDGPGLTSHGAQLQLSTDYGISYTTIQSITFGNSIIDNPTGQWVAHSISISAGFLADISIFRLVNISSSYDNRVYVDDFGVSRCAQSCDTPSISFVGMLGDMDGRYKNIDISSGAYISSGFGAVLRAENEVVIHPDFTVFPSGTLQVEILKCN